MNITSIESLYATIEQQQRVIKQAHEDIAKLTAERDLLQKQLEIEHSIRGFADAAVQITKLTAERDAATKDSARYNWLISQEAWEPQRDTLPKWYGGKIKWLGGTYSLNEINEIIDEAMK